MKQKHFELDPRLVGDSHQLCRFELCDLRLMDDANYPWLILVPRVIAARDLIDLDHAQRHRLSDETDRAGRLLRHAFNPHKLNVATLGNVVAQLHVHVIARFEDDPAWPAPVWGRVEARSYTPEVLLERTHLLQRLLQA